MYESEGGSSGTTKVSPEGRTRSKTETLDGDVAGDTGAEGAGDEDAGGTPRFGASERQIVWESQMGV